MRGANILCLIKVFLRNQMQQYKFLHKNIEKQNLCFLCLCVLVAEMIKKVSKLKERRNIES
jgi:hypothetical protein